MIDDTRLPLLLEPDELEPLLGREDLLIIDLSSADHHARHHIPGAIHLPGAALQSGARPAHGRLPGVEQLSLVFSRLGLTADRQVVACDDEGGGWAGRLIWTLDVLGHQRSSLLNGGMRAWVGEGHPVSTEIATPRPSSYIATLHSAPIAEAEEILAALEDPDVVIWDARSDAEYRGLTRSAQRHGHIPGAAHLDWLELLDHDRNLRLLPRPALQQRLEQAGITPDRRIITHCHSHHRSSLCYVAMKTLGYERIQGYHGSWAEWGNHPSLPVAP